MKNTQLVGVLKTLILLIGQNNDLLKTFIQNSFSIQPDAESFNQRLSEQSEIFLNSKEACELLKCSSVTLWKLRKANEIPFLKNNTAVRFRRTDIINYITKTK
jgi:excisionase family DNA binding protein